MRNILAPIKFVLFIPLISLIVLLLNTKQVVAAAVSWTGVSGNWETAGSWSSGSLPTANDDVTINSNVTVSITGSQASYIINSLTLGNGTTTPTLNFGFDAVSTNKPLTIDDGNFTAYANTIITHTVATTSGIVGRINILVSTGNFTLNGTINVNNKGKIL